MTMVLAVTVTVGKVYIHILYRRDIPVLRDG